MAHTPNSHVIHIEESWLFLNLHQKKKLQDNSWLFPLCVWLLYVCHTHRGNKITGLFVKEPCKTDDILQKRPIIFRSLLIVAPPHDSCMLYLWYDYLVYVPWLLHLHHDYFQTYGQDCFSTYTKKIPRQFVTISFMCMTPVCVSYTEEIKLQVSL